MSKKEQDSTHVSPSQIQREQQEAVNKALDQTRENIKKTISAAKKDIPEYAQQVTSMQEQVIETTIDIAENNIESQREIINSFHQSIWTPFVENVLGRIPAFPGVVSPSRAEVYTNTVSNIVDNFVTATRLANKAVFANTELVNTSFQQARNNVREFSRIGVTAAKNFHQTANEIEKKY
jgi:hypothetical protein